MTEKRTIGVDPAGDKDRSCFDVYDDNGGLIQAVDRFKKSVRDLFNATCKAFCIDKLCDFLERKLSSWRKK